MATSDTKVIGEFLTYDVLEVELGKSRRQLQRMIRDGSFPEPSFYMGQTPYWRVERVQQHVADLEQRRGTAAPGLDVASDEVARRLVARSVSMRMDAPLDPDNVSIVAAVTLTEDQFKAMQARDNEVSAAFLAQLDVDRAMIAVGAIFPQLRPGLSEVATPTVRNILNNEQLISPNLNAIAAYFRVFEFQTRLTQYGLDAAEPGDILDQFADFDVGRSTVLAAWLFPAMRPIIISGCTRQEDVQLFSDVHLLAEAGKAALHDTTWAIKQTELLARQRTRDAGVAAQSAASTLN